MYNNRHFLESRNIYGDYQQALFPHPPPSELEYLMSINSSNFGKKRKPRKKTTSKGATVKKKKTASKGATKRKTPVKRKKTTKKTTTRRKKRST